MSYQVNSACYPTPAVAAHVSASSNIGSIVQHGTASFIVDVAGVTDTQISYSFTPLDGGSAFTISSPYTAQECGLLTVDDGGQMGWMVVAVWVAVYAVLFLTRAMRGETGDSYGSV